MFVALIKLIDNSKCNLSGTALALKILLCFESACRLRGFVRPIFYDNALASATCTTGPSVLSTQAWLGLSIPRVVLSYHVPDRFLSLEEDILTLCDGRD